MLILSRKRGQSIVIGDDIEVLVTDIGDGKVRLGINGPISLPVHLAERCCRHKPATHRPEKTGVETLAR